MKQETIINRKHGIIDNVSGPGDRNLGRDLVLELGWNSVELRHSDQSDNIGGGTGGPPALHY